MKLGAKTKNWIFNLLAILSVVFAFSVGSTYAYVSLTNNYRSNMYSTATYMANQEYAVVNDTITNGIAFGEGSRLFDVSIQYSYSYDFDIRFQYSISWTDSGLSTDNIILHYVDRDNWIVDGDYIFYKDSVTAGSGSLKVFAGADFVDPWDKEYDGQEFKITISNVVIYKKQTSYAIASSELTKTIQTSEAAKAWIWAKNSSSKTTAYAMVYNLRSTFANGVTHPNAVGAYSRTYGSDRKVTSAQWLGGNRAYAGIGAYIITGKTAYTLTVKVTGSWINSGGSTFAGDGSDGSAFIYINNIKFNYAETFKFKEKASDNVFEVYTYKYTIPANTAVYINLVDGVEITCAANISKADYSGYSVVASIYLNETSFLAADFVDNMLVKELTTNGSVTGTTNYTKSKVKVINTTLYDSALYNQYAGGAQTFYGNLSLVNNTAGALSVSLSYKVNIYISNGHTTLFNTNNNSYADSFESNLWYRELIADKSALTSTYTLPTSVVLAPYASVNLTQRYEVDVSPYIADYNSSDAWVEVIPAYTSSTTSTVSDDLVVESKLVGSSYQVAVKNNTNATITGVNATISAYTLTPTYTNVDAEPLDWTSNYWEYYIYKNSTYTQVQMEDNALPRFDATTTVYRRLSYETGATNATLTRASGIGGSNNTYTATSVVLLPGESLVIGTISKPTNGGVYVFSVSATNTQSMISGTSASTTASVGLYHSGTTYAYIYNSTSTQYYVKFDGTVSTNEDIATINNVNYYVGVVRPGQIVKLSMTAKHTTFTSAAAGSTYSLPSGWGSSGDAVDTMYKNYFN